MFPLLDKFKPALRRDILLLEGHKCSKFNLFAPSLAARKVQLLWMGSCWNTLK